MRLSSFHSKLFKKLTLVSDADTKGCPCHARAFWQVVLEITKWMPYSNICGKIGYFPGSVGKVHWAHIEELPTPSPLQPNWNPHGSISLLAWMPPGCSRDGLFTATSLMFSAGQQPGHVDRAVGRGGRVINEIWLRGIWESPSFLTLSFYCCEDLWEEVAGS